MPYTQETHRIPHHGRVAEGTLFRPDTDKKVPLVLFCHGYNGRRDSFFPAASFLAESGIACFCLDFCGGAAVDKSGFPTEQMTLLTEKEDLGAAFSYCAQLPYADIDNLFLFGESQGGLVSALFAEEHAQELNGLILLFPALCIPDDWRKKFPQGAPLPESMDFWGMKLGKRFFETACAMQVFENIGQFDKPVLLLHGDADCVVPLSYSRRAEKAYKNAKLVVFDGEGHGFSEQGNEQVRQLCLRFIRERMGTN